MTIAFNAEMKKINLITVENIDWRDILYRDYYYSGRQIMFGMQEENNFIND